jgi:endogenous inhibitor of DNA gyrase (YacG/DUF329 family)
MNGRAARRVPCPRCAAPTLFAPSNRWRPFCSERCAGIDLGAWASEAYRVESGAQGADPQSPSDMDGLETPPLR